MTGLLCVLVILAVIVVAAGIARVCPRAGEGLFPTPPAAYDAEDREADRLDRLDRIHRAQARRKASPANQRQAAPWFRDGAA